MAAKKKSTKPAIRSSNGSFDPESSPYFAPIAFVILFAAMVILFHRFIFSDLMLWGSDTLQAGIFFRGMLVDYVKQFHSIPQWNPYIFGGMPFVDAFHGDIFYPFSFLKYFGSLFRMLGMILFWHIFFAGIFMYLAARQFKLSKIASLVAGASYMFAPLLVSWVSPGHDGKIFVTTLFPLTILFLDRGFNATTFFKAVFEFTVLGGIIGVIILSPHAQMSYFTLWALALYTLFRMIVIFVKQKSVMPAIRPAVLAVYAVLIGLLISAIQFYPGYYYTTHDSPRAESGSKSGWDWATSWSLHEEEAFSLLIPEFSGTGVHDQTIKTYYWGKNYFKDNSESVCIVALFIACIGFFFARRKEAYFFGGLAIFTLLYALGATTPFFKLFYLIPRVKSLRAPSMIMFLFSFSISLLAAMGLQAIMDHGREWKDKFAQKFNILLFGFPGLMFLIALLFSLNGKGMINLWASIFYSGAGSAIPGQQYTKLDLAYGNLGQIQVGAWFSFIFMAAAAVLIWLYRTEKIPAKALLIVVCLPVINGMRFDSRFVDSFDATKVWAPNPVTEFFTSHPGHYRVMNLGVLSEDLLPYFGVDVVVGYHGNQLRWYDDLLGGPAKSNQGNPRFLNLVGAKYILYGGQQEFPKDYFGDKPITTAASFGQVQILENDNAFPRAYLVDSFRVIPDIKTIHQLVLNGNDDLRKMVYLEEKPDLPISHDTSSADSVWIQDYQDDSVRIGVNVTSNKLLILADNYYRAWKVYVDGKPAPLLRAYGTFRAVAVPAGTKEVYFDYESEMYHVGKVVTLLTSGYVLLIILVYLVAFKPRTPLEKTEES